MSLVPIPAYWLSRGARKLDEPTSLAHLFPDGACPGPGLGRRNQVSGTEFFHLVERLSAPSKMESKLALRALEQIPGWTRVEGRQRHLASTACVVFRRDGTDGSPDILEGGAAPSVMQLEPKDRRVATKSFSAWLMTTYVRSNPRGELVRRMRMTSDRLGALPTFRFDRTGGTVPAETLNDVLMALSEHGASREDVEGAKTLWREYLRSRETPFERQARQEQDAVRRLLEQRDRQQRVAARMRHDNESKARQWAIAGGPRLDQPASLDGDWAVRNQVCGREFLHEVLGLTNLNIHVERFVVSKALSFLEGWTRLPRPTLHRVQMQFVFRRDGTDGKPTSVERPIKRRRVV